jgi:hypothetical protein
MFNLFWISKSNKYYRVVITRDLFNQLLLTQEWGSLSCKLGGDKITSYFHENEMRDILRSILLKRAKRGYILKAIKNN